MSLAIFQCSIRPAWLGFQPESWQGGLPPEPLGQGECSGTVGSLCDSVSLSTLHCYLRGAKQLTLCQEPGTRGLCPKAGGWGPEWD